MENTLEYQNLYEDLESKKRVEDISCHKKNSFILTKENHEIKGYEKE